MAKVLYFTTIDGKPVEISGIQPGNHFDAYALNAIPSESGKVYVNSRPVDRTKLNKYQYRHLGVLNGKTYEADRVIFRKSNPSNHKCDARCRHAKGGNCECSCGGKYHGAGG